MKKMQRFLRNTSGAAMIEFLLVFPVFLIIFFGILETGRIILVHQKVARAAFSISNTLSSTPSSSMKTALNDIFDSSDVLLKPFKFNSSNSGFIVSAFNKTGAGTTMIWRCISSNSISSQVNSLNGIMDLEINEGVFVIEVNLSYDTIILPNGYTRYLGSGNSLIAARYLIRPRDGGIIPSTNPCP